jgi:hypothetical protein
VSSAYAYFEINKKGGKSAMQRKGICLRTSSCSRKNGEMVTIGGRELPRCHLNGLRDCRYLILLQDLTPIGQELLQLLKR